MQRTEEGNWQDQKVTERTKGLVESLEEGILEHLSEAMMVKSKNLDGTYLMVRTNDGIDRVGYLKRFSQPERDAILNHNVDYTRTYTSFWEGESGFLRGWKYELEVLDDPHRRWKIEENITV